MLISMIQKQQLGDTADFRQICATLKNYSCLISNLVSFLKTSKDKIEQYASVLEDRAQQMETLSDRSFSRLTQCETFRSYFKLDY